MQQNRSLEPTGKAEPKFDIDFKYGRQGELQVEDFLSWIANGNGRVEVKRKRYLDSRFYVEQECDKGRTGEYGMSGINVSDADMWAFAIADTGIIVALPAPLLRKAMQHFASYQTQSKDGSCPTKGTMVSFESMLDAARQHE